MGQAFAIDSVLKYIGLAFCFSYFSIFSLFFFLRFLVGDLLASPLSRKKLHSLNMFIGFMLLFVGFILLVSKDGFPQIHRF